MVNITTDRLSPILVLHSLGPQVPRSRLRTDTERVKLNKSPTYYNGSQIVQKHGLRPQANNVSYSTVGMRRKETVGPGDGHAELMRAATAPISSLASRQCQAAVDGQLQCRSYPAASYLDRPMAQLRRGPELPLVLHKGTIGKGWPSRVARKRVPIQWYEVVVVPWATGCPAPPLPI